MAGMTVTTARLVLRRPSKADVKAIFDVHSDPETNVHNPVGPMKNLFGSRFAARGMDEGLA